LKVTILAIGRNRETALERLIETYRRRCPWPVAIVECQPKKGEREADRTGSDASPAAPARCRYRV